MDSTSDEEAYGPSGVQRDLQEARLQVQAEFEQAVGLLPDSTAKPDQEAAAERILISGLIGESKTQVLVRKFKWSKMVEKGMSKVRKFVESHAYRETVKPRGGEKQQGAGEPVTKAVLQCYSCGKLGHKARECRSNPFGRGRGQYYSFQPPPFPTELGMGRGRGAALPQYASNQGVTGFQQQEQSQKQAQ